MTPWEKYELKQEIRRESSPGCFTMLLIFILIVVIQFGAMTFVTQTHKRLIRLEKQAGLKSPEHPFADIPK